MIQALIFITGLVGGLTLGYNFGHRRGFVSGSTLNRIPPRSSDGAQMKAQIVKPIRLEALKTVMIYDVEGVSDQLLRQVRADCLEQISRELANSEFIRSSVRCVRQIPHPTDPHTEVDVVCSLWVCPHLDYPDEPEFSDFTHFGMDYAKPEILARSFRQDPKCRTNF